MISHLTVAVPQNIISRDHLPPDELEKFVRVTGIKKTRRFEGDTIEMVQAALDKSSVNLRNVKALILVTQSPTRLSPNMAVEIHNYLNLPSEVPAFDVNYSCAGFVLGLYLASRISSKTLLICADQIRFNKTPMESLIFSDAVSISLVESFVGMNAHFYTDGSKVPNIYCGLSGEMGMAGEAVSDFVTTKIPPMIKEFQKQNPSSFLIQHQANLSMNKIVEKRSGMKSLYSIEEYGNQSMVGIPTVLALNEDKILEQDVMLCGFGAGYAAALMSLRWCYKPVSKIVEI